MIKVFIIIIIALILMQSSKLFSKPIEEKIIRPKSESKSESKSKYISKSPKEIINSNAIFSPGMYYSNPTGCPGFGC